MRENPLGALVTLTADGLDANHIPFEFDPAVGEHGLLRAHVARANPICTGVANGSEVLVIFRGEHGYISPNWYPSKFETHEMVPTWNYLVVHAHGRIAIRDDERFVRALVARLTHVHEADQPKPWKFGDLAPAAVEPMLTAIVGIEIEVTRLAGKFKLSQNKTERDRSGAAAGLRGTGHESLADEMDRAGDNA
jgi:transcriptional regulator